MVTSQDMYFSWVLPSVLAGTRTPWREAEVQYLLNQGVTTLVRLQEPERMLLKNETIEAWGLEVFHHSIPDGGAPSVRGTQEVIEFIHRSLAEGKAVAVSCGAGVGRTGTILACYLVSLGMTAEQAILALRGIRSPSIETASQVSAVYAYEEFLATMSGASKLRAVGAIEEAVIVAADGEAANEGAEGPSERGD